MPQVTMRGQCFDAYANDRTMQFIVCAFTSKGKIEARRVFPATATKGTGVSAICHAITVELAQPSTLSERDQKKAAELIGSTDISEG